MTDIFQDHGKSVDTDIISRWDQRNNAYITDEEIGSVCLTSLSTIFQLYRGGQFYWWRKPEKTASHWQILSQYVVSSTHHLSGIRTYNFRGNRHWLQEQLPFDHEHDGPNWPSISILSVVMFWQVILFHYYITTTLYRPDSSLLAVSSIVSNDGPVFTLFDSALPAKI